MWGQQAAAGGQQWGGAPPMGGGKGKGKGKGMGPPKIKIPGPNQEEQKAQKDAAFLTFATNIVPTIAAVVDEHDGFCSIGILGGDARIKEALSTIPDGYKKTVKAVVEKFPDFISCFDGGRVATAKGYENGLVNQDGTINPPKKAAPAAKRQRAEGEEAAVDDEGNPLPPAMKKKKNNNRKKGGEAGEDGGFAEGCPVPERKGFVMKPLKDLDSFSNDKEALNYLKMRHKLLQERGTEEDIQEVADLMTQLQEKIEAGGGMEAKPRKNNNKNKNKKKDLGTDELTGEPRKGPSSQAPVDDNSAGMTQPDLIEAVVQIVRGIEEKGATAFASNVCNCSEARAIKTALNEHGCRRMALIFRKFPETFEMKPPAGGPNGPNVVIHIKDTYSAGMDQEAVEVEDPKMKANLERKEQWAKKKAAMAEAGGDAAAEKKVEAAAS